MARVYVSSTFADLEDHREAVRQAIRRMGHTDVAMEYYVAEPHRPLDKCLADVRDCDLYLIIMAWRYGHIPPNHTDSITHLEYQTARAAGKPCFAFVLDDNAPWPPAHMEFAQLDRVNAVRAELTQNHLAGLFTSKDDLARQVTEALQHWERKQTGQPAITAKWDSYRRAVHDRYQWVVLSVIAGAQHDRLRYIPLLDVYVPPKLRAGRPNYDLPGDAPSAQDAGWVLGAEQKQVFLGGPGSGKSTMFLANMLALSHMQGMGSLSPHLADFPVPFLIELREYALRGCDDFVAYLALSAWEKLGVRLTEEAIAKRLAVGATVVFFDGLDEIFEPAVRARVIDQFQAFTARFPKARVAVSSRIVGYDESGLGLAGFAHYTLLDFGLIEVGEFVPKWYRHFTVEDDDRDAASLVLRIAENPRLLELAGNPLLLTMMAVIYKHQDLPEKRWQLYERCTAVLLEDWDVKRKKIDREELLKVAMTADQKAEILQSIAIAMISRRTDTGRELNAIAYEPLRDIIASYLERWYGKPPGEAAAIAVEILNHLRERTHILAETGDRVFGFVHRTFMEYFAARHILAEFNRNKANYGWLKGEVFLRYWKDDQWREPLLLLSGMLAGQGSPIREVVDALDQYGRQDRFAIPFAARCLGEAGLVPPEDRHWASEIAHRLIMSLDYRPNRAHGGQDYVDGTVTAFGLLASYVEIRPDTREMIGWLAGSRVVSNRIIGWQLELSLRSRVDRREFAIAGIEHRDQAVRRGAVNALEREWPGDDRVFGALVERLLVEPNAEVRQALIAALDAGWPRRKDVLDAIEQRLPHEKSAAHATWLVEHLASAWAGDRRVLELVLKIAASPIATGNQYKLRTVQDTSFTAVINGWSESPDTDDLLKQVINSRDDYTKTIFAARLLVELRGEAALEWLRELIESGDHLSKEIMLVVIGSEIDTYAVMDWLLPFAARHPDVGFRDLVQQSIRQLLSKGPQVEYLIWGCAWIHSDGAIRRISRKLIKERSPARRDFIKPMSLWMSLQSRRSVESKKYGRYVIAGIILVAREMLKNESFDVPVLDDDEFRMSFERELVVAEQEIGLET